MRVSVYVKPSRRDIQRLRRLDRKLDRMQRVAERHIKGIGDFIGIAAVGIGLVVFLVGIMAADSVSTEELATWLFITTFVLLTAVAGSWLLWWMRR